MPKKPRLRIFAGPNGSGKSTLYSNIKDLFSTNVFINADDLEQAFKTKHYIDLSEFEVLAVDEHFQDFCINHGQYKKAGFTKETWNLVVKENVLVTENTAHTIFGSMHFAILADFIRYALIQAKISFSFETVFSHPSKLALIDLAHKNGYKVYLYFVGTDSPEVNEERVKDRVRKGGHNVRTENIYHRYSRTMDLLIEMIKSCDVVYLWDNSQEKHIYIGGKEDEYFEFSTEYPPNWVVKYFLNKLGK